MKDKKKRYGIIHAFNAAIDGILYTFKSERNMKIHYCVAVLVLITSMFFHLGKIEMIMIIFSISLVVIAEMFNTAIENTIDMVTEEYHPLAKIAKDVAAGGVLIAALNSIVVAYIIFYDKLNQIFDNSLMYIIMKSELHVTLICIVMVLISVVIVKTLTSTGTPLKGGMPSGHAALSFAMATAITLITAGLIPSTLAYLMALLVAQSRIEGKIHTFWETVAGAVLGTLVTLLVFQIGMFY